MMSWHVSLLLGTTALFCIRIDHGPGKLPPLGNSKPHSLPIGFVAAKCLVWPNSINHRVPCI